MYLQSTHGRIVRYSQILEEVGAGTKKAPTFVEALFCGPDGTRTRDPVRDRHVF